MGRVARGVAFTPVSGAVAIGLATVARAVRFRLQAMRGVRGRPELRLITRGGGHDRRKAT
ncbi:hypothetical protein [Streptomyces sp. NPDC046832]|uniref:hypothetical protein n=1 Tax=Streptomyces sp. NPDC046832 TaxID=3155020 RepID=UPI0033F6655D